MTLTVRRSSYEIIERCGYMEILQHIRVEMLAIVPVLIIIGKMLKKSERVKDKYIPCILGVFGIALSIGWILVYIPESVPAALFDGVLQGVLLAGAAVYGNEMNRQRKKDD